MGRSWTQGWRWGALWVLVALLYLWGGIRCGIPASPEALVRDGVCRQMMSNQTAGRQGLVSSAWWGPASSLAVLPATFALKGTHAGLPPRVVSAFFGAGVLLLLERALRRRGAGAWRLGFVAAVGVAPMFVRECANGSATPLVAALLVLATDHLVAWIEARRLRDLVQAGLALAVLFAAGIDAWGWVLAAVATLFVAERRQVRDPGERRAGLVIGLLPLVYTAGLWILLCWLIMGDPWYLIRSLALEGPGPGRDFALPAGLAAWYGTMMGAAVLTACLALGRRQRGEVSLALLVLALPASAGLLAWRGLLWDPAPLLVAMPALLALSVARTLQGRKGASLAGWTIAAGVVAAALWVSPSVRAACAPAPLHAAGPGGEGSHAWLADLERHVKARSRYATVFVCGYPSLALLGENAPRTFVPSLDFNFDKAKRDYYGHVLYVLVRRPDSVYAMESVRRRYPRMFIQGGPDTLYDSDWGDAGEWRLFELIQAPWTR